ncbi:hypothetical protein CN918_31175 [Priestia megaterium]|nr:hypothetical protein CN918_31175 [Priestia megaterium]
MRETMKGKTFNMEICEDFHFIKGNKVSCGVEECDSQHVKVTGYYEISGSEISVEVHCLDCKTYTDAADGEFIGTEAIVVENGLEMLPEETTF